MTPLWVDTLPTLVEYVGLILLFWAALIVTPSPRRKRFPPPQTRKRS